MHQALMFGNQDLLWEEERAILVEQGHEQWLEWMEKEPSDDQEVTSND